MVMTTKSYMQCSYLFPELVTLNKLEAVVW